MEKNILSRSLYHIKKPLFIDTVNKCFTPDKNRTHPYFYNTKVGSCSYVIVNNNQTKAITFNIRNSKGNGLNHFKKMPKKLEELKTIYNKDYKQIPELHCGMSKKPLMPYDPKCSRNRLPLYGVVMGMNNRSYFTIGNSNFINRKQWCSSYKDNYKWPKILPINNPGISSDIIKRNHRNLNS